MSVPPPASNAMIIETDAGQETGTGQTQNSPFQKSTHTLFNNSTMALPTFKQMKDEYRRRGTFYQSDHSPQSSNMLLKDKNGTSSDVAEVTEEGQKVISAQ